MEMWKSVVGYEGLYEVSNYGKIRSVTKTVYRLSNHGKPSFNSYKGKMIKQQKDYKGYLKVTLQKDGKRKNCAVHRLVAMAFIPNPDNLPQVNHRDERKDNNNVDNLEWCTNKYNVNYGSAIIRGAKKRTKPVKCYDQQGNLLYEFNSIKETVEKGFNKSCVSLCCLKKIKTHKGLIWV